LVGKRGTIFSSLFEIRRHSIKENIMKRGLLITTVSAFISVGSASVGAFAAPMILSDAEMGQLTAGTMPENPGWTGQTQAFMSDGFAVSSEATGRGIVQATYLFGNKGIGNGADPDPLGLASDHDPGVVGGGPDTTR
jgi:hypothetical protein